jgi:magnesium-transporting ATPase (P-type)
MSYDCPNCGSHQTATFEMAYQQGTQSGNISGSGFSTGGDVGIVNAQFNSQTALAERLSPPQEPKITGGAIFGSIVAGFFVSGILTYLIIGFIRNTGMSVNENTMGINTIFLFILLIPILSALGCWLHKRSLRRFMPRYLERLREWRNGMICRRCGFVWVK